MELVTLQKPNVSEQLAVEIAARLYGLEVVSIKRMVSFDDQNFHIKVGKQHRNPHISNILDEGYTLKITNTSKSAREGHFASMHTVMLHLNQKGLRAPLPVRNMDGGTWNLEKVPLICEDQSLPGAKLSGIHLLTFVPGVPVSTLPYTTELLYQWGSLMAQYHNAMEDFFEPSLLSKTVIWSLEHIPDTRNFMDGLDDARTKLILQVLDKYPSEITEIIDQLPKGFIHGDFNENNILAQVLPSNEGGVSVGGILDFEDIHYGTYVWDIGMMLAYTLLDCETMDPLDGAGHALAGYLSLRTLNELEMSTLQMCVQCRLCQSLVLCGYSYRLDPSNSYLLSSARTGWTRLEQVLNISNEQLLQKWGEIQQTYRL